MTLVAISASQSATGELGERRPPLHAGVVDADVDRPRPCPRSGRCRDTAAGSVTSNGTACTVAPSSERPRDLGQGPPVPGVDDDLGTGRGQPLGQRQADAAGRAGDDGDAAGDVEQGGDYGLTSGGGRCSESQLSDRGRCAVAVA